MNMKLLPRFLSILLACAVLLLSNCDDESSADKTVEEAQLEKLKGRWTLVSATRDGTEIPYFSNIVLVIEGTHIEDGMIYRYYFEDDGEFLDPSPFPNTDSEAKGKWRFGSDPETTIIRLEDDVQMTYGLSADGEELTLQFTCATCDFAGGPTGPGSGRIKEVNGNWTMVFERIPD